MPESYLIDININDDLRDVIRKCNHNFRLASLSQVQRTKSFIREMDTMDVDIISAADAASSAQASANAAQNSANAAGAAAAQAISDAATASASATRANTSANSALAQLGTVEDVLGTVSWIAEHGTYSPTADVQVDASKVYYERSGSGTASDPYMYSEVAEPTASGLPSYYELTVDQALSRFVASHLALTDVGLYVLKDGNGYKALLSNSGMSVIDPSGRAVATYGEGISFDSERPLRIGNSTAYIEYYDSDDDGIADSIRISGTNLNAAVANFEQTVSETYATKTEVGQKADSSTVTALSTRVTQTEADVTTAITGVNGLNALVRQYGQGVLVCRKGNTIGALVNANGSFDIVSVTWNGDTPTAGAVLTSLGSSTIELAKNNQNANIKMFNGKASISALDMFSGGASFGMQAAEVALKGTSSFYLQGGVHPKSGGLGNIVSIYNDGGNALIDSLRAPFEDDGSYPISGSYLSRVLVHSENGIFLRPGIKGKVYISEPNEVGGGWSTNRKIRAQPDTLYNNASGSNGTITLSKSSANYAHMRIYFRTDDGTAYQAAKDVYSPNGKYVPLSAATTVQAQNQTWLKTRLVKISGTSITTDTTRYANTNATYYSEFQKTNVIYITRVEAWNE